MKNMNQSFKLIGTAMRSVAAVALVLAMALTTVACDNGSTGDNGLTGGPTNVTAQEITALLADAGTAKAGVTVNTAATNVPSGGKWVT